MIRRHLTELSLLYYPTGGYYERHLDVRREGARPHDSRGSQREVSFIVFVVAVGCRRRSFDAPVVGDAGLSTWLLAAVERHAGGVESYIAGGQPKRYGSNSSGF